MTRFGRALVSLTALAWVGLTACSTSSTAVVDPITPSVIPSFSVFPAPVCPGDPHAHVYSPDRLELLAACVRVIGTIDLVQPQPDGDYHVRLHLDAGQTCAGRPCLDQDNLGQQDGDLLLEPVCEHEVTRADAIAACDGYHNGLVVPAVGKRVAATGPFVFDEIHGWNEIHPLEAITILPATVIITASSYGHLAATTSPGASCQAQAKLPSAQISTAAALQLTVTAGLDGIAAWTYRTSDGTTKGTGTHTVTCTVNGATASASAPFTVS
jgi:hypothetical protein